jgi:hypothetical protein
MTSIPPTGATAGALCSMLEIACILEDTAILQFNFCSAQAEAALLRAHDDELATLPHPPTRRPARLSAAEFWGKAAQGSLSTRKSGAHTDT